MKRVYKTALLATVLIISAFWPVAAQNAAAVPQPQSTKIEPLEQLIAATDTPLIVNLWATFCAPCVKEMPYIISITDSFARTTPVKLIFISLDLPEAYPGKVAAFLKKKKIIHPCYWLNETNADHFCPKIDSGWSGAIPATLFVNKKTGYKKFLEQALEPDEFRKAVAEMLQ